MMSHGLNNENAALVVIDLVGDFVDGKFGSDRAVKIANETRKIVEKLYGKIEIVMTRDAHIVNDPEFKIWGEHCLDGTKGSELYGDLSRFASRIIPKRHYDAFFDSDLDGYLRARGIGRLYISGISTDICVQHTVAGAFFRGYSISLIEDLCTSIEQKNHRDAVERMKTIYGVKVISLREFEDIYVER
ncbi:cysteine hydrolase family protein [Cuniculiplasma sp. SKW4]|uniref:cysteine hydrolase family protein n=1 Tax=Cuniculiplasma sp. SKW4 TaxID=3400171 RepID=UPI003FD5261D